MVRLNVDDVFLADTVIVEALLLNNRLIKVSCLFMPWVRVENMGATDRRSDLVAVVDN